MTLLTLLGAQSTGQANPGRWPLEIDTLDWVTDATAPVRVTKSVVAAARPADPTVAAGAARTTQSV